MCRLFGLRANQRVDLGFSLREASDSLEEQSRRNPDGWGLAAWDETWTIEKRPRRAAGDPVFDRTASSMVGTTFVGHVRLATAGDLTTANTHPFRIGQWVFAHNGSVNNPQRLLAGVPPGLRAARHGETDSEILFVAVLARVAALADGLDREASPALVARAIRDVASDVLRSGLAGGLNFLLSDGNRLWAHRHGYTLHWLDRRKPAAGRPYLRSVSREVRSNMTVTSWRL